MSVIRFRWLTAGASRTDRYGRTMTLAARCRSTWSPARRQQYRWTPRRPMSTARISLTLTSSRRTSSGSATGGRSRRASGSWSREDCRLVQNRLRNPGRTQGSTAGEGEASPPVSCFQGNRSPRSILDRPSNDRRRQGSQGLSCDDGEATAGRTWTCTASRKTRSAR